MIRILLALLLALASAGCGGHRTASVPRGTAPELWQLLIQQDAGDPPHLEELERAVIDHWSETTILARASR